MKKLVSVLVVFLISTSIFSQTSDFDQIFPTHKVESKTVRDSKTMIMAEFKTAEEAKEWEIINNIYAEVVRISCMNLSQDDIDRLMQIIIHEKPSYITHGVKMKYMDYKVAIEKFNKIGSQQISI